LNKTLKISLSSLFLLSVLISIMSIAAYADSSPSFPTSLQHRYYVMYCRNGTAYRFVTSDSPLYLITNGSNYAFSTSSSSIVSSNEYGYGYDTGSWVQGSGGTTGSAPCVLTSDTLTGVNCNAQIDLYSGGSVTVSNFFIAPLTAVVSTAGGALLGTLSARSSVVLQVALVVLAVLLGVSLIPRIVHLFL